jgi:hypothetical protein
VEPIVFQAERVESEDGESMPRFSYVIDASAEIVISREWWEQLAPEMLEVAVQPFPE